MANRKRRWRQWYGKGRETERTERNWWRKGIMLRKEIMLKKGIKRKGDIAEKGDMLNTE